MSKFDYDWCLAADKKVELQGSAIPRKICWIIATEVFKDKSKYNAVKNWHKRTYPDEWPYADDGGGIKDGRQYIHNSDSRPQLQTNLLYQQQTGSTAQLHRADPISQHGQDNVVSRQNGSAQLASIATLGRQQENNLPHQLDSDAMQSATQGNLSLRHKSNIQYHWSSLTSQLSYTSFNPPFRQDSREFRPNDCTPSTISPELRSTWHQDDYHRQSRGSNLQMQARACQSLCEESGSQYQRDNYNSNASSVAVESNCQDLHQYEVFLPQTMALVNDRGNTTLFDPLPEDGDGSTSLSNQQNISVIEKTSLNDEWLRDYIDWDTYENQGILDKGLQPTVDYSKRTVQKNATTFLIDPTPDEGWNDHCVAQSGVRCFATDSSDLHNYPNSTTHQPDCSTLGEHKTLQRSVKHYRSISTLHSTSPPPQYPLPQTPSMKNGVIHKGYKDESWRPITLKEGSVVEVNPDKFPINHPKKRVKGQPGSETRDSIGLYQEHFHIPYPGSRERSAFQTVQSVAPRRFASNRDVSASNTARSPLRDSGYASIIDSAVLDSMRSSLSELKLADPVDFKTNYTEDDDGFVDVKVDAKWRMRRSFIKKFMDSSMINPTSEHQIRAV